MTQTAMQRQFPALYAPSSVSITTGGIVNGRGNR
jgi:hypothetical protein